MNKSGREEVHTETFELQDESSPVAAQLTRRTILGEVTALIAGTVIGGSLIRRPLVAMAQIDDQTERPTPADEAQVSILVNQVGYDVDTEKTLVLQVLDLQRQQPTPAFQLVDEAGRVAFTGMLVSRERVNGGTPGDWGARYWSGDFSGFKAVGKYRAQLKVGPEKHTSFPFRIGHDLIFAETLVSAAHFFWFQRCGFAVPGLHAACHMDDARIPEAMGGGHRDASGGWHDAGDFNKYATISCRTVYALLTAARSGSKHGLAEESRKEIQDEGLWGAAWLYKMWQPAKGIIYQEVWNSYDYWGRPDKETDNMTGTADDRSFRGEGPSAMTAAALAAAALATGKREYHESAEDLWRGAVESGSNHSEDVWVRTSGGFPEHRDDVAGRLVRSTADLLLADLELGDLTGERRYFENAQSCVESLVHEQKADGLWPSDTYSRMALQGVPPAALALYVRAHPGTRAADKAIKALHLWLERNIRLTDNPFGLIPWAEGVFFNPEIGPWCYVGQNSQYLSNAWAMYLAAPLLKQRRASQLADRQLDWVLGSNPYNLCMMEGQGSFNPPYYLHRWAPNEPRGAVPGAIPNGFCRQQAGQDSPWFDLHRPPRTVSYHTSEPWEPHSAFYILAITAQSQK